MECRVCIRELRALDITAMRQESLRAGVMPVTCRSIGTSPRMRLDIRKLKATCGAALAKVGLEVLAVFVMIQV